MQPRKKRILLIAGGAVLGGIAGWMYWRFVGCSTGRCAITSSPVNSTIYFAAIGALVFSMAKSAPEHK
ncbi:MAG: hypothetical protein KGO81_05670 [Bacteroidota bacterium]|nr:hypothetical protein [Bacteroidota bacterium]